jgi:hypothetical protein
MCSRLKYKPLRRQATETVANVSELMREESLMESLIVSHGNVGKRPLGRPRHRWGDNIRMDLREIGWGGMDLIDLAQDRDQWRALVNLWVP